MRRRRYLALAGVNVGMLAGCTVSSNPASPSSGTATSVSSPPPDGTRSTSCDGMHDSVIEVEWTRSSLADSYAPIRFAELSEEEQSLLRTVIDQGGVGTCNPSDAFRQFIERVSEHRRQQDEMLVYLKYENEFYGLYVEQEDMVFSSS